MTATTSPGVYHRHPRDADGRYPSDAVQRGIDLYHPLRHERFVDRAGHNRAGQSRAQIGHGLGAVSDAVDEFADESTVAAAVAACQEQFAEQLGRQVAATLEQAQWERAQAEATWAARAADLERRCAKLSAHLGAMHAA